MEKTVITTDVNGLPVDQTSSTIDVGSEISQLVGSLRHALDKFNYLKTIEALPNLDPGILAQVQPIIDAVAPFQAAIDATLAAVPQE